MVENGLGLASLVFINILLIGSAAAGDQPPQLQEVFTVDELRDADGAQVVDVNGDGGNEVVIPDSGPNRLRILFFDPKRE